MDDATEYTKAVGARLRALRERHGLSLNGVATRSNGRLKAMTVGSYERGDRGLTIRRLHELATFYGVTVADLLPARPSRNNGGQPGETDVRATLAEVLNGELPTPHIEKAAAILAPVVAAMIHEAERGAG
jgi:transcriptional regulator with XRE-family HTH domain